MHQLTVPAAFGGVFRYASRDRTALAAHPAAPATLTDPVTGRPLRIATVEVVGCAAICPSCAERAKGGFVSFVADLRMVYACPRCEALVWTVGA